ncbi:GNAT family N-acetyltransferase [Paludibacterium yongneupense]|uniref:GNAT family N-acetyltransferase n=1 Tax=Paludibacterium yongneupense TaxID=400061 RepID=UPI00146E45E6|nr:GNAT family N-acetyltransferase [Paludibacterium yongneupense]
MQTELQTSRLILRQIKRQDYSFFMSLNMMQEVMRYIDPERSEQKNAYLFEGYLPDWTPEARQTMMWSIEERESHSLIGTFCAKLQNPPLGPAEIGYRLHPGKQGHGYAREAAKAVLHFLFLTCRTHKVTAVVTEGNMASIKLLEKLGFSLEGVLRQQYRMADSWFDDLHYGLMRNELR